MSTIDSEEKEYFELLRNDFYITKVEWRLYRSLFGTNKETVDLLNFVSGPTAATLDRVLWERSLLSIRKLTDGHYGMRRKRRSVTIKGLKDYRDNDQELKRLVNVAEKDSKFAKNWSDKKIAHSDYYSKSGAEQLEPASRAMVEQSLSSFGDVLMHFSLTYLNLRVGLNSIPPLNDERLFLQALYFGQRELKNASMERERLIEQGRFAELASNDRPKVPDWLLREDPPLLG